MSNRESWDFKCRGLDNHMLPLAGVSWGSDDFHAASLGHSLGPPDFPPPQKPLPPLPKSNTSSNQADHNNLTQGSDPLSPNLARNTYTDAREYLINSRPSGIPHEARPLIPLLVDVLDSYRNENNGRHEISHPAAERLTTFSAGSGSIMIGLDPTLSKPHNKPGKTAGTVLDPKSYSDIPEAYDGIFTFNESEGSIKLSADSNGQPSTSSSTQWSSLPHSETKIQVLKPDIDQETWQRLPDRVDKSIFQKVPQKAAKVLGIREPKKSKRGILFIF